MCVNEHETEEQERKLYHRAYGQMSDCTLNQIQQSARCTGPTTTYGTLIESIYCVNAETFCILLITVEYIIVQNNTAQPAGLELRELWATIVLLAQNSSVHCSVFSVQYTVDKTGGKSETRDEKTRVANLVPIISRSGQ